MNAFLPSNLNLELLLTQNPPQFKYQIDCFKYIIGLITEIPAYNKDVLDNGNFVPINAKMLQHKVRDYNKYLSYLVENGILETDKHYIVDHKSRGYRFTERYNTPVIPEPIIKYTLVKQVEKESAFDLQMKKKYSYLYKWYNDDLKIDFPAVTHYLTDQLNINTANGVENAMLKFNASYMNAYKVNQGNYSFKVDSNIFRLHTNITVMKSELRNFITYSGQHLVSVDYVNSQPCESVVLLNEDFYKKEAKNGLKFNIYNISKSKSLIKSISNKTINQIESYIMLVKNSATIDNSGFQKYCTEAQNGLLYEFIRDAIEDKTGKKVTERKDLKSIVFTVLFTDNRFIGQKEAEPKRIFRDIFPDVYKAFAIIKQHDSTLLPRILQTIESKLMLDHVAKRISREQPEMPIYTVHDSIVCPVGIEGYVAQVMKEEMKNNIGITPTVDFDYWTPENVYPKFKLSLAA